MIEHSNPKLPSPTAFGLPRKFSEWRPHQAEAMESITDSTSRFLMQVCPTGFGKSLTYITAAHLTSGRTAILTSTKGLQTQLLEDFGGEDVVDIRGKGNYPCRLNTKLNCDTGMCVFGMKCSLRDEGGCFYFDQLQKAKRAKIVITNYSYWMAQNEYSNGIGRFDMLVLDEAHSAPDHVVDHICVNLNKKTLRLGDSLPKTVTDWGLWAGEKLTKVEAQMDSAKDNRKEKQYAQLKRLSEKLSRLMAIDKSWVWEDDNYSVTLSPIWPAPFAESILFLGIPKVVLTSATVVPKTATLLGIPEEEIKVEEYPHSFPVENRPFIHLPTVRMNYRIGELEHRLWISKVDSIIKGRLGTKGIIHTVSYARRDMVMERSKYREHMITHERKNTESIVRTFKRSESPSILVSPSMATGWDFPGDEMRWQILVKVPFPSLQGKIMKARSQQDKDYTNYLALQQLIQATGRGVRNQRDWAETFIIDNSIVWFLKGNEHLMPYWFGGAYRVERTVPLPLWEERGIRKERG